MNTFFETLFGKSKEAFNESIEEKTLVEDKLFSVIPRHHKIFRMRYLDGRRYFTSVNGRPYLMSGLTGVTKVIKSHKREDTYLNKWKVDMAKDGQDADIYADMASEFGTLIHILAAELFSARARQESISTQGLDRYLRDYMAHIGINSYYFKEWYTNICKSLRSLNEFYSTTDMKVYAIEYCVVDFEYNICTPLDIVCEITRTESVDAPTKTGGTKKVKQEFREIWNLNIKARKKPERQSGDKYQICAEQYLFNGYSPDIKVAKTGTISPSWTWISKPDCRIHDFTGEFSQKHWLWYLEKMRSEPDGIYNDIFDPNLNQLVGDTNIFSIDSYGNITDSPKETVADFILSHFKD